MIPKYRESRSFSPFIQLYGYFLPSKQQHKTTSPLLNEHKDYVTPSGTVFRTRDGALPSPSSPRDLQTQVSLDPSDLEVDLDQVEPAVQLLSATIADTIGEHQSKQFAEQLLHITLDYLHKVVRNITITKQQVHSQI